MWKNLTVLLCLIVSFRHVSTLYCYVSNLENVVGKVNRLNHTLQSCNNYNIVTKQLNQDIRISESGILHCYTVVSEDVIIKGCVQKGGCNVLVDVLKNWVLEHGKNEVDENEIVECIECNRNGCNRNILNNEPRPTAPASLRALRGETSLKCYYCLGPCELTKAREKICGENIGKSREAVCTTEVSKNSENPNFAVRKCQIVQKNEEPPCPEDAICTSCKSDLCNTQAHVSTSNELRGSTVAIIMFFVVYLMQ